MRRRKRSGTWTAIRCTLVLAGTAWAAWRWWQESHRESTEAWAAGTDRIR